MTPTLAESRLPLFPLSTRIERGRLTIGGCSLAALAGTYGTPLYLYDQETLDQAASHYLSALDRHYPAQSGLTYAGKAYLSTAIVQWALQRGLWLDCSGAGELQTALAAGTLPSSILVHGVNKSPADLKRSTEKAGIIVIDHLSELEELIQLNRQSPHGLPELWLRLRPGFPVETHAYIQTGHEQSKFGMSLDEVAKALQLSLQAGIPLRGIHFHLGSKLHDPSPVQPAILSTLDFIQALRTETGWLPDTFSPGGGLGVAYHEDELPHPSIEDYVRLVADTLVEGCQNRNLPLPRLQLEPGRSLVARAGVALYKVGAVKHSAGRRWLLIDGGLADNPRPALYGAQYSALPVLDPERAGTGPAWLGGPFCESGDTLIQDILLPEIQAGEVLAVPVSGAYQLSMSSNYNGACRPAVLWISHKRAKLIQRREMPSDLIARDIRIDID